MRVWILPIILVASLVAGCIDPPSEGAPVADITFDPEWSDKALAFGGDHDHTNRAHHHNMTTPNFGITGYDPLESAHFGNTPAGYACGDAKDTQDGRRIAVIESRSDIGFTIAEVTDPAEPKWLGELVMETTYVYDLAVVPDGKHAVLVTSQPVVPSVPGAAATPTLDDQGRLVHPDLRWKSPCAPEGVPLVYSGHSDPVPRPVSILLVDISEPTTPSIVDQRPLPGLGHSVFSTEIDGRTWILASNVGNPNAQVFQFYELMDVPTGTMLNHLSSHVVERDGPSRVAFGGHTDGWIQVHPVTGQTLAYVTGDIAFQVLDLADPTMPEVIGSWTDATAGRSGPVGALHSVVPHTQLIDGRHYTIIGPEYGGHPEGQPSGNVWVLDTTDPTDVHEVGAWTLPHEVDWDGTYMFSNHYLGVWNTTIFVSMYHGGVWALDLGAVQAGDFTLLPSIGVFMPTNEPPNPSGDTFRWAPNLQEVVVFEDGTLVTFDSMSGLYTFRFDDTRPAPAPEPWPVEPVSS